MTQQSLSRCLQPDAHSDSKPISSQPSILLHLHAGHCYSCSTRDASILNHQTLNLVLERTDLGSQITALVRCNAGGNDAAADSTGSAQRNSAGNVDVGNVLVFCQQGKMEKDRQRSGIWWEERSVSGDPGDRFRNAARSQHCEAFLLRGSKKVKGMTYLQQAQ